MIDITCSRCGQKIGWRQPDGHGVVIRCECGRKNLIGLMITMGLDSTVGASAILTATSS